MSFSAAPRPSRLDFTPTSMTSSQWLAFATIVAQQLREVIAIGDGNVQVAVIIEVRHRHAPTHGGHHEVGAQLLRHLLKLARAQVAEHQLRLLPENLVVIEVDVIHHTAIYLENIYPTIIVVIKILALTPLRRMALLPRPELNVTSSNDSSWLLR